MAGIQALLAAGLVPADFPARDTARSILTAVQGGVVMLRATGRRSYLETALGAALRPVFRSSGPGLASRSQPADWQLPAASAQRRNSAARAPHVLMSASVRAIDLAVCLPAAAWQQMSAGDGAKGPRLYDWAFTQATDSGLPAGGQAAPLEGRTWLRPAGPVPLGCGLQELRGTCAIT
jgi:hypothetical protein